MYEKSIELVAIMHTGFGEKFGICLLYTSDAADEL